MNEDEMRELERKSRAAFDASVEAGDAATRSRLARARAAALDGAAPSRPWPRDGLAARGRRGRGDLRGAPVAARRGAGRLRPRIAAAFEDLDIVAGGEDFDLLGEDADFVAWAAEQIPDGVG